MTPLVSVVIPAYNASRYIRTTVASVLQQTCAALEVIVVDDGSTDGTPEAVREIADDRVRVVTRPNGGPAAARNDGIRAARAQRFIAFLDADDAWDSDKIERQIAFLDSDPDCLVVGCLMRYVSSSGRTLGCSGLPVTGQEREAIARADLFPFPLSSFLVRRAAIESVGGFDETLGRPSGGAEDMELLARLAQRGGVGCIPTVLGSYRIHPASAMARDRRRINREARFVRRRLQARLAGTELTWEEFTASTPDTWRDHRQDMVEVWYRTAALWYGEGRPLKAITYGTLAALANPAYTFRRVYQQRLVDRTR